MANYHIKWDETNKKWTFAVDGGSFADLVERPSCGVIKLIEDPIPTFGQTYGQIVKESTYHNIYIDAGSTGAIVLMNDVILKNDGYFYAGKSGSNPMIVLDSTDYLLYDRSANKLQVSIGGTLYDIMPEPFQRGGIVVNPNGITAAINVITWYAPFACTVKNVRGYRVGGTGATINARKNGSSNHLSSNLSLTSADTWTDGGSVANASYSAGDKLEIMVASVTGSPTQVGIQVDFTRP